VYSNIHQLWLHWGFASRGKGWKAPVDEFLPEGTKKVDDKAVQSPFKNDKIVSLAPHQRSRDHCHFEHSISTMSFAISGSRWFSLAMTAMGLMVC
jgi:hypothetical protein